MAKNKIDDWQDIPIDDWQDVPVEQSKNQPPKSFAQTRLPYITQGIKQARIGNTVAGGLNIANQIFSEVARPFQQADELLRQVPAIGKPLSNILRIPPYLAGKAVDEGTSLISSTGIPQFLEQSVDTYSTMRGGVPMTPQAKIETAQALGTTNQMISPFLVVPPIVKTAVKIPKIAVKASQATADALSQSGYKIPTTIKAQQRTELLRTAQKENIVPTKKGLEKLDNRVGELKQVAEGLEQKAIATGNKTVPVEEIVASIQGVVEKWSKSDTPKEFVSILENYKQRVLTQQKSELSIQDMIDLKRNLQKQLSDVYVKQMKINPSIRQNLLQEAKSSIETNVRQKLEELIPDYKNTNSQIHKLLKLKPYVEQAANRISNQDIATVRLKDIMFGGGMAGVSGDPVSIAGAIIIGRVLTDQRVQAYLGNKLSMRDSFKPQSIGINIKNFPINADAVINLKESIPSSYRKSMEKQLKALGENPEWLSDAELMKLYQKKGLDKPAPISEAPVSRGGSMDIRGAANEEQIRRFKQQ